MKDTIVAVATSMASSAGINIVRISGENALKIEKEIFTCSRLTGEPEPNRMYLGRINGKNFTEKAFCVYCRSPFSYTGEDVVEIHCHGGKGVTNAILRLVREHGARPAEPGEFTKRAFLNGKMSLSEAEGVLDMINASSESQIRTAYALMTGDVMKGITESEKILVETAAALEAKLDYPEELEEDTHPFAKAKLAEAQGYVESVLQKAEHRKTVVDGIDIAIVGIPNAGKSSLLNALIGQERAIVSDEAGTTRDVVKESVDVDGIRLNFLDTAGLRGEGAGKVERIGIEKSWQAIESAAVVINVKDTTLPTCEEERKIDEKLVGKKVIVADNKCDVGTYKKGGIPVCAKSGEGVGKITDEILRVADRDAVFSEGVITNERHVYAMEEALRQIKAALGDYDVLPTECVLENVREALEALGKITGRNVSDMVIDEIFSRFCVGK